MANRKQGVDLLPETLGKHENEAKKRDQGEEAKLKVLPPTEKPVEAPEVFRPRHGYQQNADQRQEETARKITDPR